jgi:hypothetical protein
METCRLAASTSNAEHASNVIQGNVMARGQCVCNNDYERWKLRLSGIVEYRRCVQNINSQGVGNVLRWALKGR